MVEERARAPVGTIGVIQQKIFGLPVDRKILFSNYKNVYRKNIEKRQRKLVIKVSFLKPFIKSSEKVLCITTGHSPVTIFEKMGIGWLFVYLKRSLFVFTDQRILHIPTTPVYKYRQSITEILYGSCKSVQMKGRTLVVEYKKTGAIEKFFSIAGKEKKKIAALLKTVPLDGDGDIVNRRTNLCPRCITPLPDDRKKCQNCELKFKNGIFATLLAVLLPGGGYFYVRQYFLGIVSAILEILFFITIAVSVNDYLNGMPVGLLWPSIAILLLILEKIIVIIHIGVFIQDFIPQTKKIIPDPGS